MKKLGIAIIIGLLITIILRCGGEESDISASKAKALVGSGEAFLLDVREAAELKNTGMAENAKWLATSSIDARDEGFNRFVETTDKSKIMILYCQAGVRAGRASSVFKSLGYSVRNMGGLNSWKDAGYPVVSFDEM
jgi:rhodanese-related sulfurtransferase